MGRSRWHEFLDAVLPLVAVGGRISGYLARDIDLARRGCRAETTQVRVQVPVNCTYFPHETALVPVITVVDESAGSDAGAGWDSSDIACQVPVKLPTQVSFRMRRRVARSALSTDESAVDEENDPSVQLRCISRASMSRRRRFADIRACLDEQEQILDAFEPLDATSDRVDNGIASEQNPSAAATRQQFLAGLRRRKKTKKAVSDS